MLDSVLAGRGRTEIILTTGSQLRDQAVVWQAELRLARLLVDRIRL